LLTVLHNRLGRAKIKPLKKIPETAAIFDKVAQANQVDDDQTQS
jgi:hypothetical protein